MVKVLLDVTINLLCIALGIIGVLLPWRLIAVVTSSKCGSAFSDQGRFREWCLTLFGCALMDLIFVPLALLTLLWPPRWRMLFEGTCKRFAEHHDETASNYDFELRLGWGHAFVESVADVLATVMGLVALGCPWRTLSFLRAAAEKAQGNHELNSKLGEVRCVAFYEGFSAILDAPCVLIGLPSVVVPTRTCVYLRVTFWRHPWKSDCEVRSFWLVSTFLAIVDLVSMPFAVVALINPLRTMTFVRAFRERWSRASVVVAGREEPWPLWDWALRRSCLGHGAQSILDILLLPMALVVFLTVYRARPLVETMCPGAAQHLRGAGTSSSCQCLNVWLLQDYQHLSDGPQDAPAPASAVDEEERPCWPISVTHLTTLRQFCLILADVVVLPAALLVLLTCYRWHHIVEVWWPPAPSEWAAEYAAATDTEDGAVPNSPANGRAARAANHRSRAGVRKGPLAYHKAAIFNALVVLHDAVLMLAVGVLFLSVYRAAAAWRLLRSQNPGFRGQLWREVLELCLDLLFLPLLLVLLVTLWRADIVLRAAYQAEGNWPRRCAIVDHFVRLLRDVLGMAAALVVAVSLVRLPSLLLELWAQRARTVLGDPWLHLRRVVLLLPDHRSRDARPRVHCWATQPLARRREEVGQLRLNVVSPRFWDEIGRVYGGAISSLARGFMPFTLTDGKQLDFDELLPAEAEVTLKMGSRELRQRLLRLDPAVILCLQLEHKRPDGTEEVLARLPMPLELYQQAARREDEEIPVPEEFLEPEAAERLCGPLQAGAGVRETLWLIAFKQLLQLALDVLHLALLLLTVVAPWRTIECLYYLCASKASWVEHVAWRLLHVAAFKDDALLRIRRNLEPVLNRTAKAHAPQVHSGQLQSVEQAGLRQLSEVPLPPTYLEKWLGKEVAASAPELAEQFRTHGELRDAVAAYWPSMSFAVNLQHAFGHFDPMEHAHALHLVASAGEVAEHQLSISTERLRGALDRELPARLAQLRAEEGGQDRRCFLLSKPLDQQRRLIRHFASSAAADWGAFLLLLLIAVTGYRLPQAVSEVRRGRDMSFRDRLKTSVVHHAFLVAVDVWRFVSALVASLLALITLVRALEFLEDAALRCSSLWELRSTALRHTRDALRELWELMVLLTLWKTYRAVLRSVIFGLFLPAYGLLILPGARIRLAAWAVLCVLCFCLEWPTVALVVATVLVLASCVPAAAAAQRKGLAQQGHCYSMHLSWLNVLALLGMLLEVVLLSGGIDALRSVLLGPVALKVAVVIACLWLLVTAMPPAITATSGEQDGAASRDSIRYHFVVLALRQVCVLPAFAVLLATTGSVAVDGTSTELSIITLLTMCLLTSMVLSLDQQKVQCSSVALRLDVIHPPLFLAGLALLQALAASLQVLAAPVALQALGAVPAFLWVYLYPKLVGPYGGPEWLQPIRGVAALLPVWTLVCASVVEVSYAAPDDPLYRTVWMVGCGFCILVATARALMVRRSMVLLHRGQAEAHVVRQTLRQLSAKGAVLSHDTEDGVVRIEEHRQPLAAPDAAAALEAFEDKVRIERLDQNFLLRRQEWLDALRAGRDSWQAVAAAARELLDALRTPPTLVLVFSTLRASGPAAREVPGVLWNIILEYLGTQPVMATLLPAVETYAGGGPAAQFKRAVAAVQWCTRTLRSAARRQDTDPAADSWEAFSAQVYGGGRPRKDFFRVIFPCWTSRRNGPPRVFRLDCSRVAMNAEADY